MFTQAVTRKATGLSSEQRVVEAWAWGSNSIIWSACYLNPDASSKHHGKTTVLPEETLPAQRCCCFKGQRRGTGSLEKSSVHYQPKRCYFLQCHPSQVCPLSAQICRSQEQDQRELNEAESWNARLDLAFKILILWSLYMYPHEFE